jgi:hypothetical protein
MADHLEPRAPDTLRNDVIMRSVPMLDALDTAAPPPG